MTQVEKGPRQSLPREHPAGRPPGKPAPEAPEVATTKLSKTIRLLRDDDDVSAVEPSSWARIKAALQ